MPAGTVTAPKARWETVSVVALICGVFVLLEVIWIAIVAPSALSSTADSAAVIGLATTMAIGIERAVELMWTLLGSRIGTYWPLNRVTQQVQHMITDLSNELGSLQDEATRLLNQAKERMPNTVGDGLEGVASIVTSPARFDTAQHEIQMVKTRFDTLADTITRAPSNQRVQLLATAAAYDIDTVYKKYQEVIPDLRWAATSANRSLAALQDFVEAFKDNPGRRVISLLLGVMLGLGLAGAAGIDLFGAILGVRLAYPQLGVILTGVVIGLGANPTHEVIRTIQEYKESAKGRNIGRPDLGQEQ
jgi:hypothetical protein